MKRKAIKRGNTFWSHILKCRFHTKIIQKVRYTLYHWILHNHQVLKSPISNDFIYVSIDGNFEKQLIPKLLLQVYVQELHNSMVSPPE